jgi:hypothetical protein
MLTYIEATELVYAPLPFHEAGLSETVSGYGVKLTSPHKVRHNGRLYRVYNTCVSNASSSWIVAGGKKLFLRT